MVWRHWYVWTLEGAAPSRVGSVTVYSRVEEDVITGGRRDTRQGNKGESVRMQEALSRASQPSAVSPAAKLPEERAGGAGK